MTDETCRYHELETHLSHVITRTLDSSRVRERECVHG